MNKRMNGKGRSAGAAVFSTALLIMALLAAGCASQPASRSAARGASASAPESGGSSYYAGGAPGAASQEVSPMRAQTERASVEARQTGIPFQVLDWANRGLGEDASPGWLLPAIRGNFRIFKQDWQIRDDKVLKVGVSRAPALNAAMVIADVQYAARLSNQLRQAVVSKAAITLGSDDQFTVVNDAATKTSATLGGQERLCDFWQLTESADANGRRISAYTYYVVYACDPDVWSKLVAKYLYDLTDKIPDQRAKQTIAAMFNEIDAETRYDRERSEAEFAAEIRSQQEALKTPPPPAAQREAYRSGDPVRIAAASVTKDDADYIAALAALAGLE